MIAIRGLTDRLSAFNRRFGRPVRSQPTVELPMAEVQQFVTKLREEVSELIQAISLGELVDIADGLGDSIYVISGIALQYGLDIDVILDVVHRSNMTKDPSIDGEPRKG